MQLCIIVLVICVFVIIFPKWKVIKDNEKKIIIYYDFLGRKRRKIHYFNTGIIVTYDGNNKMLSIQKTCHHCGRVVKADKKGWYHCCGRKWL